MSLLRPLCLVPLLMIVGCEFTQDLGGPSSRAAIEEQGAGGGGAAGAGGSAGTGGHRSAFAQLPLEGLQYPMGLWVRDGKVYFTEAAATGTSYGGIARLSVYDLATSMLTTLVDNPVNHDAVAVASDGKIYLGGWLDSIPGNFGHVSVVDPVTLVESPVTDLDAAVTDMFMDDADDLYVAGAGSDAWTTAIYRLAAGDYAHPSRYRGINTDMLTASGDTFYLDNWGVSRFTAGGPEEKDWVPDDPTWFSIRGLTVHGGNLFYGGSGCSDGYVDGYGECPPEPIGEIRSVPLATGGSFTTVASGLGDASNLRADPVTGKLYFLEFGTDAGHYLDGRLREIDPSP